VTLALGPTRPDKLTLWPVEGDRYGIDVVYVGSQGWRRANVVRGQLGAAADRPLRLRNGSSALL
jgi:hypothetical protein